MSDGCLMPLSRKAVVTCLSVAAVSLLIAAGTASVAEWQAAHAQQQPQQIETRQIGVLLTHNNAGLLGIVGRTFELAASDFNKYLAENNRDWRLEVVDTVRVADPGLAPAKLGEFNSGGVKAVVGLITDEAIDYSNRTIHDNGMVVVASFSGLPRHANDDNVFRTANNYRYLADSFLQMAKYNGQSELISVIPRSPISTAINASLYELAPAEGITMLGSIGYDPNLREIDDPDKARIQDEMRAILERTGNPENVAIFVSATPSSAVVIGMFAELDSATDIGRTTFYGPGLMRSGIEGDDRIFPFLTKTNFYGVSVGTHENEVNIRIDSIIGRSLVDATYDAYDALFILGRAIDKAGTAADADAIKAVMREASRDQAAMSARGIDTTFDEYGDASERDYRIYSIRHGVFEYTLKYDPDHDITEPVPYREAERRVLGAIVSETGGLGDIMGGVSRAISMAVNDFNLNQFRTHGPEEGWRFNIAKFDDRTDPVLTARYMGLLESRFGATEVVGPAFSSALDRIKDTDAILLSYGSQSTEFSVPGDNIFRTRPDSLGAVGAFTALFARDGISNVVVIYRDDTWGRSLSQEIGRTVQQSAAGVALAASISYPVTATSYEQHLGEAAASATTGGSTAIVLLGFDEVADIVDAAMADPWFRDTGGIRWYGFSISPLLEDPVRADWLESVEYTTLFTRHVPNTINARIDAEVSNASIYSYLAYDAVMLMGDVLLNSGIDVNTPLTKEQMDRYANNNRLGSNTALGVPLVFNDNGDLRADSVDYNVHLVLDGKYVPVSVYDTSDGLLSSAKARVCR